MKKVLFLFFSIVLSATASGQEMWGISNSNFAGVMGLGLNPASMVAAPYWYEIHAFSGDFFVQNNYIYIRKRGSSGTEGESTGRFSDYYNQDDKYGYGSISIKGPSAIFNRGNSAFAFYTAWRNGISARDVPYHVAKFIYDGFDYIPQQGINYSSGPFHAALLEWAEFGLSLGTTFSGKSDNLLTGAITVKYLGALNAAFLQMNSINYNVVNTGLLVVSNIDGSYGHSEFDSEGNIFRQLFSFKGSGAGADIGLNYFHGRLEKAYDCSKRGNDLKKYNFRIGLSAIDMGFVHLGGSSPVFKYNNASTVWPGIDTIKFDNLTDFDTTLSNQFLSDPTAALSKKGFDVTLPAAVSLQFDYCIKPRFYINASVIQRLPVGKIQVQRPNQVSITPRYETRSFEAALTLSTVDYAMPRVGLAFRYKFLVLGTDKIGPVTGLWDITGIDFFFGLKFQTCSAKQRRVKGADCFAY